MVFVKDDIAHRAHFHPWKVSISRLYFTRDMISGFANDFKVSYDSIDRFLVFLEILQVVSLGILANPGDAVQDVADTHLPVPRRHECSPVELCPAILYGAPRV